MSNIRHDWTSEEILSIYNKPLMELLYDAANRRLMEEMGMKADLDYCFAFIYKALFDNGWVEHEYDHVFKGVTDALPQPDKEEVSDWKYISLDELKKDVKACPEHYTVWFRLILDQLDQAAIS